MNDMDAFEKQLKESLTSYEVPYNSADWAQMERALSSGVRGWGYGRALITGLLLAGGLLIGGTAYYMGKDDGVAMTTATKVSATEQRSDAKAEQPELNTAAEVRPEGWSTGMANTSTGDPAVEPENATASPSPAAKAARSGPAKVPAIAASAQPAPTAPKPAPATTMFRASVDQTCPGSPVDFTVEHMPEDGIYLWNFGDGSFSNKPNPQHTFTKPGSYQVMLSMSNLGMGTIHNKPSSDMIVIHEAPAAAFNVVKQDYAGQLPSVHFENLSQGSVAFLWDLGDGATSTASSPDHVYKTKGVYKVELTVTNETGCVDRKIKEVWIEKDYNLDAPASFSPNGDGKEETFMPEALHQLNSKFQLTVYDPSGILVYSTNDPTHPWCGKVKNQGVVCDPGDYVWVVDVEGGSQAAETFTGKVKLVR